LRVDLKGLVGAQSMQPHTSAAFVEPDLGGLVVKGLEGNLCVRRKAQGRGADLDFRAGAGTG
jgi:hypothetical protein